MPTYEYRCPNDHAFEVFHGIKDEAPRHCPECGAVSRRVPSGGAGFLFKGSGFYITDYRSDSYRKGRKADTTTSPGGSAPSPGGPAPSTGAPKPDAGGSAASGPPAKD